MVRQMCSNVKEDLEMNFFYLAQTLLEDPILIWRRSRLFAVTPLRSPDCIPVRFQRKGFSESIKLGYAALSASGRCLDGKGGWVPLQVRHRSGVYLYTRSRGYPGADRRRDSTGSGDRGLYFRGDSSGGRREDHRQLAQPLVGSIYARPEIKTPEDLKGKKLGISRFGALSETAVGIFLERFGLKRGTDVAILQLGGLPEIITAMEKGSVDAGFASPPNSSRAKRLGMRELFDIDILGIELQQTCVTVTTKYLREHRPVVKSFVQAYAEGLHRFVTDREFSIRVMKKYLRVDEKEMLDDAYTFFSPRLQKIPYPTLKGIKFILDALLITAAGKERGAGEFRRFFAASRTRPERVFQAALEKLIALEACKSLEHHREMQ